MGECGLMVSEDEILNIFYLYYLRREDKQDPIEPELLQPFYVGRGCNGRIDKHRKEAKKLLKNPNGINTNPIRNRIIHKLWFQGLDFVEEITLSDLTNDEANYYEMEAIAAYGRIDNGTGCLANMTDGGDGCPNLSEECRTKSGAKISALWEDEEWRKNQVEKHTGYVMPEEQSKNIVRYLEDDY
jgi:hypothetical protein